MAKEKMVVETGSQNTVDAYGVVKGAAEPMTIAEIAEQLGVTTSKVTGGLVSLEKKGAVIKSEKEAKDKNGKEKMYKAYALNPDVEVEFISKQKSDGRMSDNAVRLLQYLQANPDSDMTHAELAEAMGWQTIQVVGAATALAKKGLIDKPEATVEMPDGSTKTLKVIVITEEGKAYKF